MSGFLRGHSCCTALLKMVDDWRLALDSKKITGAIAIDLSKALDSICHNLLLAKLRAYMVLMMMLLLSYNHTPNGVQSNAAYLKVAYLAPCYSTFF